MMKSFQITVRRPAGPDIAFRGNLHPSIRIPFARRPLSLCHAERHLGGISGQVGHPALIFLFTSFAPAHSCAGATFLYYEK